MQVRKFEASSMKEALEMVKNELGPDAIILAADENKSFGLMGRESVQVTAAVSEAQLKKREFARKHLRAEDASKFNSASAKVQKQFIEKSLGRFMSEEAKMAFRDKRYVDIIDDEERSGDDELSSDVRTVEASRGRRVASVLSEVSKKKSSQYGRTSGNTRVQEAVQSAMSAARSVAAEQINQEATSTTAAQGLSDSREVQALKAELSSLRSILFDMQKAPKESFSVHPGADRGIPYELSDFYSRFLDSGIDAEYATDILRMCRKKLGDERLKNRGMVQGFIAKHILGETQVSDEGYGSRFHIFVGPSASGKTSSLVKYAAHLVMGQKKKVGIISADTDRIGGSEQLRVLSKILNAPFLTAKTDSNWDGLFQQLAHCDYVLIDMPSMNLRHPENQKLFREKLPPTRSSMDMHYVISSHWRSKDAYENLKFYMSIGVKDLVVTKLDEVSQHGLIYNLQRRYGLPLHSFGTGDKLPGDFEFATRERVLDLLLKITKKNQGGSQHDS